MGTLQQICLKWRNHQPNFPSSFHNLLQNSKLVDVTIACERQTIKAHKVVLSACSPFFSELFADNPAQHPIVILRDAKFSDLQAIIEFMYVGEVNISQEQVTDFLKTAESLQVKGLTEEWEGQKSRENEACASTMQSSNHCATKLDKENVSWESDEVNEVLSNSDDIAHMDDDILTQYPQLSISASTNSKSIRHQELANTSHPVPAKRVKLNSAVSRSANSSHKSQANLKNSTPSAASSSHCTSLKKVTSLSASSTANAKLQLGEKPLHPAESVKVELHNDDLSSDSFADEHSYHEDDEFNSSETRQIQSVYEDDEESPVGDNGENSTMMNILDILTVPVSKSGSKASQAERSKWTDDQLQSAVDAVRSEAMTFTQAARAFEIPRTTLYDNVLGTIPNRSRIFERVPLTQEEEEMLLQHIEALHADREPVTMASVAAFAENMIRARDETFVMDTNVAFAWWWAVKKKYQEHLHGMGIIK